MAVSWLVPDFLEFFAGGGMARAGLAKHWACVWANDFSEEKALVYRRNWGSNELQVGDLTQVQVEDLPDAVMAWASFPCQDLSLAGEQNGIGAASDKAKTRSGTFWEFWRIACKKKPFLVVLENVEGALTSNEGRDFRTICSALRDAGYKFGPLVIDALHWVPQSRRRLFIVGVLNTQEIPAQLSQPMASALWHSDAVCRAYATVDGSTRECWVWWNLPTPQVIRVPIENLIEENPTGWGGWDSEEKTNYLLSLMNKNHLEKVQNARRLKRRVVGLAYRRTRAGRQQAEVRFDGIAGCLRTAGGGSSKQIVIEVSGKRVRSRLLSPREAARLQGLPDSYWLPDSYNEAYDLVGDGLCVPVVDFLGQHLLTPLASRLLRPLAATA